MNYYSRTLGQNFGKGGKASVGKWNGNNIPPILGLTLLILFLRAQLKMQDTPMLALLVVRIMLMRVNHMEKLGGCFITCNLSIADVDT